MTPGDRVRHHNPITGRFEDGRLLRFEATEAWTTKGRSRTSHATVQFRGRRRAYCSLDNLEVLK